MKHRRGPVGLCAILLLPLILLPARATTIIAETGRHAYGWQARYDEFGVVSWTQTNTYYDVKITAPLYSVATDDTGTAYLTRRMGPGTTLADQVATAPVAFPGYQNPSEVVLFTGLTLGPGTYYLFITGGTNYWSSWTGTDQPTLATDAGVTHNGDVYVYQPAAYPPASTYYEHSWMRHIFSVTGYRAGENRPPVANAGLDQEIACSGTTTSVLLDGRASNDPNGDALTYTWWHGVTQLGTGATLNVGLSGGLHSIRLVVTDGSGSSADDTVLVNIADTTPPMVTASATPAVLRPPNGKMVPVVIQAEILDFCGSAAAARIVSVQSDDPSARPSDWEITGDLTVNLRARRSGRTPRTYVITVEAMDSSGNSARTTVSVFVPR
jgi:hypothetical protein